MKAKVYVDNEENMVLTIGGRIILETPAIYGRQSINMCIDRARRHGVVLEKDKLQEALEKRGVYEAG